MIVIVENTFYTVLSLRMEILEHYKKLGYKVVVLSYGASEDILELENRGFTCYQLPHLVSSPFSLVSYLLALRKYFISLKPQLVCTFTIRPNLLGSILCGWLRLPVVSNITGIGPLFESNSPVYIFARLMYRFAFRKNKVVFFQNESDYNEFILRKYVLASKAVLLPGSGVDTQYYSPVPSPNPKDGFIFLMTSRLIKDKGVVEYLEAAKRLKKKYPNVRFQLLGPFWTQSLKKNTISPEFIENYTKEGIVEYLGKTYDVRPFIAQSHCIVLPSYREGNSNVLMQGGSMEKPLIASNVVGCNNLVQDNITGFLVPSRQITPLAEAMEKMLLLPESKRDEMGKAAREFMKQNYEKKLVLKAYESVLN